MHVKSNYASIKVPVFHLVHKITFCVFVDRAMDTMIVQYVRIGISQEYPLFFVLRSFSIRVDMGQLCNSSVCLNGGLCDDNGTTIRCVCPEHYAGPRCEWSKINR